MMEQLTGFQRDLLIFISGLDEPYGLELQGELRSYYGEEVTHTRIYDNVDELIELGLVEKHQKDKRTNSYTTTDAGEEAIAQRRKWVAEKLDT